MREGGLRTDGVARRAGHPPHGLSVDERRRDARVRDLRPESDRPAGVASGPAVDVVPAEAGSAIFSLSPAGTDVAYIERVAGVPTGALRVRAIDGTGPIRTLTTDAPTAVAADTEHVYFDYSATGAVVRCKRDACPTPETVALGLEEPTALAADDRWVYVATKKGVMQLAKP